MFKMKHQHTADCVVAGYRLHKSGDDAIGSLRGRSAQQQHEDQQHGDEDAQHLHGRPPTGKVC
jgi:ATP-dependent DNA ligase